MRVRKCKHRPLEDPSGTRGRLATDRRIPSQQSSISHFYSICSTPIGLDVRELLVAACRERAFSPDTPVYRSPLPSGLLPAQQFCQFGLGLAPVLVSMFVGSVAGLVDLVSAYPDFFVRKGTRWSLLCRLCLLRLGRLQANLNFGIRHFNSCDGTTREKRTPERLT